MKWFVILTNHFGHEMFVSVSVKGRDKFCIFRQLFPQYLREVEKLTRMHQNKLRAILLSKSLHL